MNFSHIIKRPLITEKSTQETAKGKYTFAVDPTATKNQIKQALETAFKVTVLAVNTAIMPSKTKKIGRSRRLVKTQLWKKATVQLSDKDKIDLFDIKTT